MKIINMEVEKLEEDEITRMYLRGRATEIAVNMHVSVGYVYMILTGKCERRTLVAQRVLREAQRIVKEGRMLDGI